MGRPLGHFRVALCSLLVWVCVGADAGAEMPSVEATLSEYSSDVVQRLHEKKVVVLPSAAGESEYVAALVIFEQPLRRTLDLLFQTTRQIEYIPEIDDIVSIERDGTVSVDEHRLRIMFIRIDYRIRTRLDSETARIWWELDPDFDNDLHSLKGFWELYEMDRERTLGYFGTRVEVGPILPEFFQEVATRRQVPRIMKRVRHWVNSDGTYRP